MLTWLFSGQRSDQIAWLRVGCIRRQHKGRPITGTTDVPAADAACMLDVPAHKTGTAFSKSVDPILGQAIDAWQAARPDQPRLLDRRTGEIVVPLFATCARCLGMLGRRSAPADSAAVRMDWVDGRVGAS